MDPNPLVGDLYPRLAAELTTLLNEAGEPGLARQIPELRLVADCGCGDDFCRSFATVEHPEGKPYGPGHRNVILEPEQGMLVLDVIGGAEERIAYVEVLYRDRA
ncbi:hypothetical protein [Streptomyces litchfieldiae]|uniref:Uncharacterized protein n=1 Tax=Streptomyces litchfieldiae TaxID=3075543 RepID=A0ABU2MPB1_9ACTN|nr:hypothetical protein [Streptomyces sp. DSM 44938]MDT0343350.1 hypothetical protein [Streptomyces sp. DSM 44938]